MFVAIVVGLVVIAIVVYFLGKLRSIQVATRLGRPLHSRPRYHGGYLVILTTVPSLVLLAVWLIAGPRVMDRIVIEEYSATIETLEPQLVDAYLRDVKALAFGGIVSKSDSTKESAADFYEEISRTSSLSVLTITVILVLVGFLFGYLNITPEKRTRNVVDRFIMLLLTICSGIAILTTIGIVISLIFESLMFFRKVSIIDFVFGTHWSPQSAFEGAGAEATETNSEVFGAIPLLVGTMLITVIAVLVAAPIGLLSAIYLSDYASAKMRAVAKPLLEILAGIPTVVYGFFAALTMAPFFRDTGESVGLLVSSESALAAGFVMGIMIIPFVSSLSDDVINSVPQSLRDGSAGLGATKSETIRKVVLPAALPGIVSALILAISRAIGETMIVVMAAGLAANLTINPLEAVTTVTVQIVTLLVGDQEFDSAKTLAAFALGLLLLCITLVLNMYALRVVKKYKEQYD